MKIAIIGYGAMGKIIKSIAEGKGHEICAVIDEESAGLPAAELAEKLVGADAAIDFSVAGAVLRNVSACCIAGVPLVEGTTGWNGQIAEAEEMVRGSGGAMVYGANFSIGVNLFYRIVDRAAELFSKFEDYEVFIEERHHSRKVDAPSGTALKLKAVVNRRIPGDFSVASTRAGSIPGTHIVGFDGPADQISLTHTARSREGFASGAVAAAEWMNGRKGFWEFTELVEEMVAGE